MSLKFTPEMFEHDEADLKFFTAGKLKAAELAQAAFDKWLSEQPVVYGAPDKDGRLWSSYQRDENKHIAILSDFINDTHQARLVCVEEIQKKECEHIITAHLGTESHGTWYECRKCDKRLKAEWTVIE